MLKKITDRRLLNDLVLRDRVMFLREELLKHSELPKEEFKALANDGYDIVYTIQYGRLVVASVIHLESKLVLPLEDTLYYICRKYGLRYAIWERFSVTDQAPSKAIFRPVYLCPENSFIEYTDNPNPAPKMPVKRKNRISEIPVRSTIDPYVKYYCDGLESPTQAKSIDEIRDRYSEYFSNLKIIKLNEGNQQF